MREPLSHRYVFALMGAATLAALLLPWAAARSEGPTLAHSAADGEDAILPLGRECTVVLGGAAEATELTGRLDRANARWLVLHVEREARSERGLPALSKVPYTGRLFKNVGIGRTREDVWVPRDRVLYLRVGDSFFERESAETPAQ
jgi:hypothetical protein